MDFIHRHKVFLYLLCISILLLANNSRVSAQRIYWAQDGGVNQIRSSNLDGSDIQTHLTDADGPFKISVDLDNGFAFYLTQQGQGMSYRSDLNNFSTRNLLYDWGSFTSGNNIAHHPGDQNVYYNTFVDSDDGRIEYTAYTAQDMPGDLVNLNLGGYSGDIFEDIDVDTDNERVYVSNSSEGTIYFTPTFGGSITQVINTGNVGAMTLDVNDGKIYWANNTTDQILSANLNGSNIQVEISTGLSGIKAIEVSPVTGDLYIVDVNDIKKYDISESTLSTIHSGLTSIEDISVTSCIIPGTQASTLMASNVTTNSVDLSWNKGSGDEVIVIAKEGSAVDVAPESGNLYTASNVFSDGDDLGSGNYVVYRGTGNNVSISGLSLSTDYHFAVYGYNSFGVCYRTFSPGTTSITTLCNRPTVQVTDLTATVVRETGLTMTYTAGDGNSTIVLAKSGSAVDAVPADGTNYTNNLSFGLGDEIGSGNFVVYKGTTGFTPTDLPDGITHFAAFTYNNTENCYLTTSPSRFQGPDFSASIVNTTSTVSLSSVANDAAVFGFTIDAPSADLQFFQLNINGVSGTNEVLWSDIFDGATLSDNSGNSANGTFMLSQSTVTFNSLDIANIGFVPGGGTKEYTLSVSFRNDITSSVADDLDNRILAFEVSTSTFFIDPSSPSTFLSSTNQSASSGGVTVDVTATQIGVLQQPSTNVDQFEILPQQPIFEAIDVNGNRDIDFTEDFTVGTASPDDLVPMSPPTTFTAGLADFAASGFNFQATGRSTMHILSSASLFISDDTDLIIVDPIQPILTATDVMAGENTNCVNENGSLEVTSVFPGLVSDYTFILQDDMAATITGDGPIYNNLSPGTYTIFAMNNSSSLTSAGLNVTIVDSSTPPALSETIMPNSSCVGANGMITLDVDAGASNTLYVFEWFEGTSTSTSLISGTANANQAMNLPTGDYTVRVTSNLTGCFVEATFNVPESLSIPLTPMAVPKNGCEGATLPPFEIDFTATSSEINWYDNDPDGGGNLITNSLSTNSKTLLASDFPGGVSGVGTFTVFATYIEDITGCESAAISTSIIVTSPASGTLSVTTDFDGFGVSCNGDMVGAVEIIASGGAGPYTFELIETGDILNGTSSATFNGLGAGDYTVIITDANTCTSNSNTVTITEPEAITTGINVTSNYNGAQVSCTGESDGELTVTASNGNAPFSYQLIELPSNTSGASSGVFNGLPQGTYSVTVMDANGCSVTTSTVDINDPMAVTTTPIITQEITCAGNADGQIATNATGGSGSFRYVLNEVPSNTTGASTGIFTGLSQGSYSVTVSDENNCSIVTTPLILNDPPAYSATLSGDVVVCEGTTVSLVFNVTGGTAPYEVTLSDIGIVTSDGNTIDISPTESNTFTILGVTDAGGCAASNISGTANVTVDLNPTASVAGTNQETCDTSITLDANVPSVGTGVWARVRGTGVIVDRTDANTTVTDLEDGENVFSWTISNGTCTASTSEVTITKLASPSGEGVIATADGRIEFCQGTTGVTLTVTGIQNATAYNWTLLDESITSTTEPSITFDIPADTQTSLVRVVGENLCGENTQAGSLQLTIIEAPNISINSPDEVLVNGEANFSLALSTPISGVFWEFGDGATSSGENVTHTYTAAGQYTIRVSGTSSLGCDVTGEAIVNVSPADPISIKNAITPNGDGANDQLIIVNIEFYPNNTVTLFDRWGVEVASFEGYRNEWDLTVDGDVIPAGNYICVVELPDTNEIIKRTVTVVRSSN